MHLRYREMNYILMVHLGKPLQMEKTHHLWNCGYIFLKYDHVSALNYLLWSTYMRWSLLSKVKLESRGTRPDRSLHFVIMGKMLYVICVIEVYTYYLLGWWWVFGWYLVISVSFLIPFLLLLWLVIRYFYGCTLIISKHDPSFLQFQSILLTFNDRKKFDTSLFESLLYALLAICIM